MCLGQPHVSEFDRILGLDLTFGMHHTPVLQRLCLGALIWMVFHLTTGLEAASVLRSSSAVRAGMSQERLSRIDQMLDDAVQSNEIPGAVALIARRGKVVLHKAYGTADPETGVPMQSDSIFRIASQTKAITST
ncbi:MAG: serine hydrolase domain-containing protein, partial [Verrucomicrobiota bacterium]|nr:serine hydrolase domain-containing protein [Verrucomicrobiota bacterium]